MGLKINPLSGAYKFLNKVREKADQGGEHRHKDQRNPDPRKQTSEIEVSDEKVREAIEAFIGDSHTSANGLTAVVQGEGAALKVLLRDASGQVVRQYTAEEFLRLRESASQDNRSRGRLLDKKL